MTAGLALALKLCTPKKAIYTSDFQALFLLNPSLYSPDPCLDILVTQPPDFLPPLLWLGWFIQTLSWSGHSLPFLEFYGEGRF